MSIHLVTGGAGFIGSHLVSALVSRGDRVRVLDNLVTGRRENLAHLAVGLVGSGAPVEFLEGDIADPRAAKEACRGVTALFHEAAQVSVPQSIHDPNRCYAINVGGTLNLLEAARESGVQRVVFAASSAAYGDTEELPKHEAMLPHPLSPYASSKVGGEHLLSVWGHVHGLKTVSLRYFNVFGPRQVDDSPYTGVIAIFAKALIEGRRPTVYGDGEQTRDFTYIANVVQANLLAIEHDLPAGAVVNVGSGSRITINELFRAMATQLGSSVEPRYEPARAGDVKHSVASLERASKWLGYAPRVGWRDGLRETVDWYRQRLAAPRA
ncbi:MAG: SDR family oxidoreductase [Planctomycetes bacterium]|nr:SDR family oxidoreductase [Planctomycetota bacterium]